MLRYTVTHEHVEYARAVILIRENYVNNYNYSPISHYINQATINVHGTVFESNVLQLRVIILLQAEPTLSL